MVFPDDKRSPGDNGRYVPLRVARQVAAERDQLMAQAQKLRRENDQLKTAVGEARSENEVLRRRAATAEEMAAELRQRFEEYAEHRRDEQGRSQRSRDDDKEARIVAELSRRIEGLTADMTRMRARRSKEIDAAKGDERRRLLSGLGEVLDSIERGLEVQGEGPWRQGLEAIRDQFLAFFRAEGAVLIGEQGETMDPQRHQALAMVDGDGFRSGQIVRVERRGIELADGTIVRPAQVVVAK